MKQEEFAAILDSVFPSVYLSYGANECPDMPYITYFPESSQNFAADGVVYLRIINIQVDLWFSDYEKPYEEILEKAFKDNGIYWEKTVEADDNEKCIRATYSVTIDDFTQKEVIKDGE